MAVERTLSILKPDTVGNNEIGEVLARFEEAGLKIVACRMLHLSKAQAESFYEIHKQRPFFTALVEFMTSGPVLVSVLEGEKAVERNRDIMGATNPKDAKTGTIRHDFAKSIDENAVHGSDSLDNAHKEIAFFFKSEEICERTR